MLIQVCTYVIALPNNDVLMIPFGLPYIQLIRLLFLAGTVFFSHNNSAGTVFFNHFQPSFRPANGAKELSLHFNF